MRNQDIVRDIADRPGALFGPADSRAAFVNLHASSILPKKSGQPANGLPVAPPLKNMAELKIHVDGLPLVLVFPMEEVVPSKRPGVQSDRADIHSLVSSTLEKIVDRLRGSDRQGAILPSKPALKVVEKVFNLPTLASINHQFDNGTPNVGQGGGKPFPPRDGNPALGDLTSCFNFAASPNYYPPIPGTPWGPE